MYNFFGKGADELYKYIIRKNYDTVICTHPFASLMLTETKRRHPLSVKTAFVATDYTCSPSVKDSELDYYFIPSDSLISNFECKHITKEKIIASGIPIRQMFYSCIEKDAAKQNTGILPEHKHMVMMCGSMGCGPIEKIAGLLTEQLQEGFDLTVVCGTNGKLKARLEHKYGNRKNLHICGFVKDMSALLDSADLYLTKAGGISITEAATKQVPMIFIHAVAGCEDHNRAFYTKLGCAVKSDNVTELVGLCTSLVTDQNRYHTMAAAFETYSLQNASQCIFNTLKEA